MVMDGNSNLSDILDAQESQIIRLASRSNLGGVLEQLGSDLLYVDHSAHTPLVIIKKGRQLFGFSISLRTATASLETYEEFRKHMRNNIEQLQLTVKPPETNILTKRPQDPVIKIKSVLQLNNESRTPSLHIDEECSSSKRTKNQDEMKVTSEEKRSRDQSMLTTIKTEDTKPILLKIQDSKSSPICDRQIPVSPPSSTSPGLSVTSESNNSSSACDSETDSKLNQPYNPFAPLSPCGSASPYDPASPTQSATPPSDSGFTGPVEPKSLAKRLKRLARRGSFDAPAPSILLCPDIPPLENTFGEIYTYASFLEIENDASMPSMSPPQEDPLEHCGTQITVKKNEVTESPKKEAASKSSQSKSKGMSAKSNFTGKKSQLEKIRDEVKSELKPYLARGNISQKIYEKILTKSIPKIYNSKDKAINKPKIRRLVQEYVKNYQQQQVVKSI